ncbi:MAG: hypothetical protein FJ054_11190 [Cyanobacteria bacterium M_surface_10_m2_119]|nr:hypothetical protein [Cyanobacteria bacterium M_surface_10_m2_119]
MDHAAAPLPFERLPEEPAGDYAALLLYRDLGPGRSLGQAADVSGRSESTLRRLAKRWAWQERLEAYDARFLARAAAVGAEAEQVRHRAQLVAFRDAQHRRAERLADAAEQLLELVVESTRKHLAAGTLLQPAQLGAGLTAAARALEASGSTAATALGVEELLEALLASEPNP